MLGQEKRPVYASILLVFAAIPLWAVEVFRGMGDFPHASNSTELILTAEGKSDYQIVVPEESPSIEIAEALNQTARLIQCAFKANGFDLPVASEAKRDASKPGIYLGNTERTRAAGVVVSELTGWDYVHKVVGRDIIIAGRDHPAPFNPDQRKRRNWDRLGTAKGVTDFLRQYVGTRFLYPDIRSWSSVGDAEGVDWLKSPAIEFLDTPVIKVPWDLNLHKTPFLQFNIAYPHRASFYDIANNRFTMVDTMPVGHTYHRAIPVEKYYDEHPEYLALIGGERVRRGQYCVSKPQVQELNFGRDCDCRVYIAGGIAGILCGIDALPAEWVQTVDDALKVDQFTVSNRSLRESTDGLYQALMNNLKKLREQIEMVEAIGL